MNIKINIKKTFRINGKEYHSLDEVPAELKEAVANAMKGQTLPVTGQTKITFNGTEYESLGAMPPELRQLYEGAMHAAETSMASPDTSVTDRRRDEGDRRSPTRFESSLSGGRLVAAGLALLLIFLFYYLLRR